MKINCFTYQVELSDVVCLYNFAHQPTHSYEYYGGRYQNIFEHRLLLRVIQHNCCIIFADYTHQIYKLIAYHVS